MFRNNSYRPKTKLRYKIALIIFGVLCCILLLEIGLRLGGFIFASLQEYNNKISLKQKSTYIIMCVGESTTVEGGKNSYPAQLEEILNQRNVGTKFSVINRGVFGSSTSYIIAQLEDNLNKYKPGMVIAMMGIDDNPSILPYQDSSSDSKIIIFFKHCRVYKLVRLLQRHIAVKINEMGLYNPTGDTKPIQLPQLFYIMGPKKYYLEERNSVVDTEKLLKKNIELNPKDVNAYIRLGELYKAQGKYNSAERILKRVIQIAPGNSVGYLELGLVCLIEDNYIQAEKIFKKAVEVNPQDYRAYVELGWYYVEINSYVQAENLFKKAIELNLKCQEAYAGLGRFYTKKGDNLLAEEMFKRAVEVNSKDYKTDILFGEFYANKGNYSGAEVMFKKALELNPKSYIGYFDLGWCYVEQGSYMQAEQMFKRTIELNSNCDYAYGALAVTYSKMGKYDLAEQYYKKANSLRLNYYNPATLHNYHRLKEILDNRKIKLVCVQYPVRSVEPLKKIFEGQEEGIIFVDNEKVFKDAINKANYKEYFVDMFAGDFGHCTTKGNRLLAENIANVILKEYFKK